MVTSIVDWTSIHLYSLLLYGGLACIMLAVAVMFMSIGSGQRSMALHEMRIYVRLEIEEKVKMIGIRYSSEWSDRLLRSMGWPQWITASKLKILRDVLCLMLLMIVLLREFILGSDNLLYPIIWILALYSTLSPSEKFFSIFSLLVAPLFRRIHNYRVGKETAVLIQLLRNEVNETKERSVLSIIQQFQKYFKILRNDLLILEHEWKNRKVALDHLRARYPNNEEIYFVCSVLEKLDEIGYMEAAKTLRENEQTLTNKQNAAYISREKDVNQVLAVINISGLAAACLWGILALFMWAYSYDFNY